jgi:hypothetical protein
MTWKRRPKPTTREIVRNSYCTQQHMNMSSSSDERSRIGNPNSYACALSPIPSFLRPSQPQTNHRYLNFIVMIAQRLDSPTSSSPVVTIATRPTNIIYDVAEPSLQQPLDTSRLKKPAALPENHESQSSESQSSIDGA